MSRPLSTEDLLASMVQGGGDVPPLTGLATDSRRVQPGDLFAAMPGQQADGRQFVDAAIAAGAAAVLLPKMPEMPDLPVPVLASYNIRRSVSLLASRLFPRQPEMLVAVTGTNGKTSTVEICRQLWAATGLQSASLGTLGVRASTGDAPGSLTTPDPLTLHRTLDRLAGEGISHAALEASSHGLDQERLAGVRIKAAAFTNLTRDHLDYHKTMDNYFAAKARLFADILPTGGVAVLNMDIPWFDQLRFFASTEKHTIITFGRTDAADLQIVQQTPHAHGQTLSMRVFGERFTDVPFSLYGTFQAENLLAALGMLVGTGSAAKGLIPHLARLADVPGRMQRVTPDAHPFTVFVDYAHTDDALKTVLQALRPHTQNRLHVVFGCGGDRDPGKRLLMGQVAGALADGVTVTDDNPRTEDPALIRAAVLAGCPDAQDIGDRRTAIATALNAARPGDTVVVAGKGHETGQTVGTTVYPFSDTKVIHEVMGL